MKKYFFILLTFLITLQTYAFEDYIIMSKGKLNNISIEDNTVVDIFPIVTIINSKNTLMITPLRIGKTKVSIVKNNKEKIMFNVEVFENKTIVENVKGIEAIALDTPVNEFELDEPPMLKENK